MREGGGNDLGSSTSCKENSARRLLFLWMQNKSTEWRHGCLDLCLVSGLAFLEYYVYRVHEFAEICCIFCVWFWTARFAGML
ncbi:hypothetical protein ACOSP7_030654 [Xanthoceras sorbifolium]